MSECDSHIHVHTTLTGNHWKIYPSTNIELVPSLSNVCIPWVVRALPASMHLNHKPQIYEPFISSYTAGPIPFPLPKFILLARPVCAMHASVTLGNQKPGKQIWYVRQPGCRSILYHAGFGFQDIHLKQGLDIYDQTCCQHQWWKCSKMSHLALPKFLIHMLSQEKKP